MSWPEALELLSAELSEPVTFRVAAERQFLERLTGAGVPAGMAELLITREWAILAGENDYTTGTFQQITGRPPHAQSPSSFTTTARNSSDARAARVRYLTQVIWGPGYRVAVEPVTGEADTRPPEEIACWEAGLLAVAWCWFAGIRPGDDAAIAAVLARDHPVYADYPQITLDKLAAMIVRRDRR
jgi:hypothetical protein